ncbi:MAG: nucleoid-associated protein, YbaB/EbfC family [Spirochaetes bacterium GWB1_66_5]|jgi:DNA-binding YbaB/EbfC family protein|nr:MAG: nucleoid-associated protein, YbaB/EbfC family [Spirochaetes bacterium GWB1_66_5]
MAVNPFELFKQFGNLQERMNELQGRLGRITAVGSAGGGMVQVELNGHLEAIRVTVAPEAVDPVDLPMLQDLLRAALSDALVKVKEKIREEVSSLTGGLPIPPGFMGM